MKTEIKKYNAAVASGDLEAAQAAYKSATKKIDVAAAKGIIHKNAAAHKKSQFTKALNGMQK
jgi:small subunit ribosomal protein S20